MRGLQFIAFWLLLIFQVESQATTHRCNILRDPFPSCNKTSVLKVTKSPQQYQVILLATEWQCYNDFCLVNDQKYWQKNIKCNETCRACQQLQPPGGNGKSIQRVYTCKAGHRLLLDWDRCGLIRHLE